MNLTKKENSALGNFRWWEQGIIYQVYPFMDGNGDGIGDLAGIRQKLGYLEWLGVDAIWISPIYPSPMVDFGYDVSNYTDIDPLFGTLEQFDVLLADGASGQVAHLPFNFQLIRLPWKAKEIAASLLLSTYLDRAGEKLEEELQLRGDEGVIIELL
jgi:hypothetical protein